MEKCIFCRKQTNNGYSYYMADKEGDVREEITVFACTKCLKKTGVIVLSVISFFFMLSFIGNISGIASGKQPMEVGPLVSVTVMFLLSLIWTFYKVYLIKTDKPLSETSAAKKLIRKAKKANPLKCYFTPAENALLTVKQEKKTTDPLLTLYEEVQHGKVVNLEIITASSVEYLIRLYGSTPKGEGFLTGSNAAERVRMVGELLNKAGGFQLMLEVHKQFAATYNVMGAARNLEMVWDGIGGWAG